MIDTETGMRRRFLIVSRPLPCTTHPAQTGHPAIRPKGELPKRSRRSDAFRPSPLLTLQPAPTKNQHAKISTSGRDFALLTCCLLRACRARLAALEWIHLDLTLVPSTPDAGTAAQRPGEDAERVAARQRSMQAGPLAAWGCIMANFESREAETGSVVVILDGSQPPSMCGDEFYCWVHQIPT